MRPSVARMRIKLLDRGRLEPSFLLFPLGGVKGIGPRMVKLSKVTRHAGHAGVLVHALTSVLQEEYLGIYRAQAVYSTLVINVSRGKYPELGCMESLRKIRLR